jgi:hypothetical protein
MKRQITNFDMPSPVLQDHGLAVVCVLSATDLVAVLNVLCSPSNICRLIACLALVAFSACVATTGLDSVQGVRRAWSASHVCQKLIERFSPTRTDKATLAAIVPKVICFRVVASFEHHYPNLVFPFARVPVSSSKAHAITTTLCPDEPFEMVRANAPYSAARQASAGPVRSPARVLEGIKTESANNGTNRRGNFATLGNSHETILSSEGNLWLEPASGDTLVRLASVYDQFNALCAA